MREQMLEWGAVEGRENRGRLRKVGGMPGQGWRHAGGGCYWRRQVSLQSGSVHERLGML